MNQKDARNKLSSILLHAYQGTYPIATDDTPFDPPNTETPWLRLSVQFNDGSEDTIGPPGARKKTRFGRVFVQVFTPVGTGTNLNDTLSESISFLYDNRRLSADLWTNPSSIRTVGMTGKWYQQNVSAMFEFEQQV